MPLSAALNDPKIALNGTPVQSSLTQVSYNPRESIQASLTWASFQFLILCFLQYSATLTKLARGIT